MIEKKKLAMVLPTCILSCFLSAILVGCSVNTKPREVELGKDNCAGCSMAIEDAKFACEFISDKGRCYKFDDLSCLFHYIHKQNIPDSSVLKIYVADYQNPSTMLDIQSASLVLGNTIHSPMNGGVAAFSDAKVAEKFALESKSILLDSWKRLRVQH